MSASEMTMVTMPVPKVAANWHRILLEILLFGALFIILNPPLPYYTSNQNAHLLRGLEDGGMPQLKNDWLAETTDPYPVFSALVAVTSRFFAPWMFAVYQMILAGLYIVTLCNISEKALGLDASRRMHLAMCLLLLHSVLLSNKWVDGNGSRLLTDGVAGQYILHNYFQPCSFGVFLLLAIDAFLSDRFGWAAAALAAAATFHTTFLLPAGILLLAFWWARWREPDRLNSWRYVMLGSLLLLPITLYMAIAFVPSNAATANEAANVLFLYRMTYHTRWQVCFRQKDLVRLIMIAGSLFIARGSRLFQVLIGAVALGGVLTVIEILTENRFLALQFPWRISSVLTPIATAVAVPWVEQLLLLIFRRFGRDKLLRLAFDVMFTAALLFAAVVGIWSAYQVRQRALTDPVRNLAAAAAKAVKPDQQVLIPTTLEDFRLAAGVPVYVDYKSHPYQSDEILEWSRRMQVAHAIFDNPAAADCGLLEKTAASEKLTHFVAPKGHPLLSCAIVKPIYSNEMYTLSLLAAH